MHSILIVLLLVLASSMLLKLLVLSIDHLQALSQLLDLVLPHNDIVRDRIVIPIHPIQFLILLIPHSVVSTLRISCLLLRRQCNLFLSRLNLIKFVLAAHIFKELLLIYDIISQFLNSLNQLAVLLHDIVVVLTMQRRHLLQLVVQLLIRISQELSLRLELLLDVLVYIFLLLLLILHIVK